MLALYGTKSQVVSRAGRTSLAATVALLLVTPALFAQTAPADPPPNASITAPDASTAAPSESGANAPPEPDADATSTTDSPSNPSERQGAQGQSQESGSAEEGDQVIDPEDSDPNADITSEAKLDASMDAPPDGGLAPTEPVPLVPEESPEPVTYEAAPEPEPPKKEVPWLYRQGRIRLGVGVGWASSSNESWTILGAGAGVFALDGLQVEFDSTFWLGGTPFVATVTPGVRYVLHFVPVVQPYVGAFYRHYFLDDGFPDTDSIGARGGVYFMLGKHVFAGGGVVYEHFLDDDVFVRRDDVYPELTLGFVF